MLDSDTALGGYIAQLDTLKSDIIDAEEALASAGKVVGKIKTLQQTIEEVKDDSVKLRETAKSLDQIVDLLTKFGPLKALARPIEALSGEIRDRAEQLDKQVGTITEVVVPFQTVVKVMDAAIKGARAAMWDARGDIVAVEESLTEASETLANTEQMLPAEAQATYDAVLGPGGTLEQIAGNIDGVAATLARVHSGAQQVIDNLTDLEGFADSVAQVASQIAAVLEPVSGLTGPLSAVGDVLEDFDWVLDAADWVFDRVVSPVLDPILEALGIEALIDRLSNPLQDLMPDIDLLPGFLGTDFDLGGQFEGVFGPVDSDAPGIFTDAKDAAASLTGLIQVGTTGIVGELLRDGAGTDDFLMGINTVLFNESTLNGGDGGDILGAGAGDDTLNGGADDDILLAGIGDDILDGGTGTDAVVFNGYFGQFSFVSEADGEMVFQDRGDTGLGAETTRDVEYFVFRDITWQFEQLERAIRVDYTQDPPVTTLLGDQPDPDDPNSQIINDILIGGDRDDVLLGLTGDDYMLGYAGYDTVRGGTGTDTYSYAAEFQSPGPNGATVILDLTLDPALLDLRDDDIREVENITGSNSGDLIVGNEADNDFNGGGWSDTLVGGLGDDRLVGAGGTDTLIGGRGNDTVIGGLALDLYIAGRGADTYIADPTDAARNQDFDLLYYGATYSELLRREVRDIYETNFSPYDAQLLDDLPDAIDANLTTGRVRKLNDQGTPSFGIDTLVNISNLLATDGNDLIQAGSFFAILDGAAGDDRLTGFRPTAESDLQLSEIEGDSVALRQGSILVGGLGDDQLLSWTGDDVLLGGDGDDWFTIASDTQAGAPDDRLDQVGAIFGGFDTRDENLLTLVTELDQIDYIRDFGWDTLDMRQSDQAWLLRLDQNTAWAYQGALPREGQEGDVVNEMRIHGIELFHLNDLGAEIWASDVRTITVYGGAGDDHLNGHADAEFGVVFYGNGGNDQLTGSGAADWLEGGDGDDILSDLTGTHDRVEHMIGGAGDDILRPAANSAYNLDGGDGQDLAAFNAHDGALVLDMGRGRGTVFDRDFTETGVEAVIGSRGDDRITGTNGADLIAGHDGDDRLVGLAGDDALFGGMGDDNVQGGAGDDRLHGGLGFDTLFGGRGYDMVDVNATAFGEVAVLTETFVQAYDLGWTIDLAAGRATATWPDDATGSAEHRLIGIEAARGGDNDDTLIGNQRGNLLSGEGGDDEISGAAGADVISGGDGDDTIRGGTGADQISGNRGENLIYGGAGNDIILGADVDDPAELVYFNAMREDLRTGRIEMANADAFPVQAFTIDMMVKADPVHEMGQDAYTLMSYAVADSFNEFLIITDGASDQLRIIINNSHIYDTGIATGDLLFDGNPHRLAVSMDAATGTLAVFIDGVEHWRVTDADGVTSLTAGGHLVFGQDQDGVNAGYNPDQAFIGAMGDIRLYDAALDADALANSPFGPLPDPGMADDLLAYWQVDTVFGAPTLADAMGGPALTQTAGSRMGHSSSRGDNIYGEAGADQIHGGAGGDTISGGNHNDLIHGDAGRDTLSGDGGRDTIHGGTGRDNISGGDGDDMLEGGDGADQIAGDNGDDTLIGGEDADFMVGGAGRDTYVYRSASEAGNAQGNLDYIHDFVAGVDRIDLSAIDANSNTAADDAFVFVGFAGFTGQAGQLALREEAGLAVLGGDLTGDGQADFEIFLGSIDNWSASDFVL